MKINKNQASQLLELINVAQCRELKAAEKKAFGILGLKVADKKLPTWKRVNSLLEYNPDEGTFMWKKRVGNCIKPGDLAEAVNGSIKIDKKTYQKSHIAWLLATRKTPKGKINCVDGNERNFKLSNLEDVPPKRVARNRKLAKNNSSGITGVSRARWSCNKWVANIHTDGKAKHIGSYDSKAEAIAARKAEERARGYHPNAGRNEG